MDNLISRQAAIDAPEEFIKDCNPEHFVGHQKFIEFMDNAEIGSFGNWQFANGFNMGLTAAEVAIKDLPSAPRWTSCKERLPKPDQVVDHVVKYFLVQDEYGDMMVASYQSNERGKTWWEQMNSFHAIQDDIVAWQELPKPWKGE